jgi:hypothetical protein
MDMGETSGPDLVTTHNGAKVLECFCGATFGELNVVPQNQTIIGQHCKKTLNIIRKPKSFQNKQIMLFLLHIILVIDLQPKVYQLNYISYCFVMMILCVLWEGQT